MRISFPRLVARLLDATEMHMSWGKVQKGGVPKAPRGTFSSCGEYPGVGPPSLQDSKNIGRPKVSPVKA